MLLVVESSPCSPNRLLEDHRNAQHLCRPLSNYITLVEFKLEIVIFPTRNSQFIWHVEFLLTGYIFIFFLKWSRLLPSFVRRAPMTALVSPGWSRYTKRISFHFRNKIVLKNVLNMFFCEFNRGKKIFECCVIEDNSITGVFVAQDSRKCQ